jgi:putative serine protease PepD
MGFPGPLPPRAEPRASRRVVTVVAAAAIALAGGGVGGFVGYALHGNNGGGGPLQSFSSNNNSNPAPVIDRSSLASIAASVQPAVVDIKTQEGEGSGVVISSDGYIVTNNHVVAGAQNNTVQVGFNSGHQVSARIVGADAQTDIAVVKADATGLSHLDWANSDDVRVGDTVLAIGSPLGLQGSVTAGIVSALHRTIQASDQQSPFSRSQSSTTIGDAIQTDAAINPGNSGGALVNTEGKVIGINTAIATGGAGSNGNIGVGFAISGNKAKSVASQLVSTGKVSHPFLGVSVSDASSGGALISAVQTGSAADKAGIKQGDVVIKVNDRTISSGDDLVGAIQSTTVGSQVQLTIVRNGQQSTVTATVGEGS